MKASSQKTIKFDGWLKHSAALMPVSIMITLEHLQLFQFKNYQEGDFYFNKKIVGICGLNGTGKTNLLDAIYYLAFTKSNFSATDSQLVTQGQKGFRLQGSFKRNGEPLEVLSILRENGKKEFSVNGNAYSRMSQHLGLLPTVIITPDDIAIITNGSEGRRKMLDTLLCQLYPEYLEQLILYKKILLQRNSMLKQWAEHGHIDQTLLEIIDYQLSQSGARIFEKRVDFSTPFLEKVEKHYHEIAQTRELIKLSFESILLDEDSDDPQKKFLKVLDQNRLKDRVMQRTTMGVHRDDLRFGLGDQPFRQIASQGQRKSLLFALKLTEFEMLEEHKGFPPLLLLDDVFEKLDANRMKNLLMDVCVKKQGQVFITDTHRDRLEKQLGEIGCEFEILETGLPA